MSALPVSLTPTPPSCVSSAFSCFIGAPNSLAHGGVLSVPLLSASAEDIVQAKNKILSQNPDLELQSLVRESGRGFPRKGVQADGGSATSL